MAGTAVKPVTPNFFKTMGIPQRAGRDFAAADTVDSPKVAIVSEALVRQQYPERGSDRQAARASASAASPVRSNAEIVGVVGDIKMVTLDGDDRVRRSTFRTRSCRSA